MSCHHQCNRRIMDKQRYMDQCLIQTLMADVVTGVDVVAAVDDLSVADLSVAVDPVVDPVVDIAFQVIHGMEPR